MKQTTPRKSLGQHWLYDEASLNAMLEAGGVTSTDVVLEVGPGLGTLTKKLCQKAEKVIAVELDNSLAANLEVNLKTLSTSGLTRGSSATGVASGNSISDWIPDQAENDTTGNLTVINQSILDLDTSQLPTGYKLIANIPYYLTSNLIRVMLENQNPPRVMALLIQKEVAERIVAEPGQMSILSIAVQFYATATLKEVVPAKLFTPPPKVDSQIIQIKLRDEQLYPDVDPTKFFQLVRAGFSEKRKKLRSSLSGGLHISKTEADKLLTKANIPLAARAQELTLDQWHQLYLANH